MTDQPTLPTLPNGIYDLPDIGFCKIGDVTFDEETKMMTIPIIPVTLEFSFTVDKDGAVTVDKADS